MSRGSLADRVLSRSFRDELERIFNQHNRKVHSEKNVISRDCSTKTRQERRNNLRRSFAELHQLGFHLGSPTSLKQKHLHALAEHWQQKGLAPKTLHGLISNFREFARWTGKRDLVQDISVYCGGREHLIRRTGATEDLSWEAHGIDVPLFLEKVKGIDKRLWLYLCFQRYFGLRTKESIELRPWRATAQGDEHLYVTDGTKGGKHRMVPIRSDRQREIIDFSRELVGQHLNAQLRWPDKTWRQAQAHFYYLMRRLGVTHELMGVSPHGLRHGFLQDEYEHFVGLPAPIKGGSALPENRFEYKRAMLALSLEAGHFREAVTGMYCGSLGHQLRSRKTLSTTYAHHHHPDHNQENQNEEEADKINGKIIR